METLVLVCRSCRSVYSQALAFLPRCSFPLFSWPKRLGFLAGCLCRPELPCPWDWESRGPSRLRRRALPGDLPPRKVMTSCMRELQRPLPPKCGKELWRAETSKPQRCLLPQWLLLEAGIMMKAAMKASLPDSARSGESCMAQTLQVMPDAHT